jgi:L-arabinose isomerase
MKPSKNYVFWFVTGSQHLYGPKTLEKVKIDSHGIVTGLNEKGSLDYPIEFKALLTTPEEITSLMKEANNDPNCAGIIGWMHTFSPAKMWIKGLRVLSKPFVHLHTQFNRDIPWSEIDMDFMNLNQSAHGGREFGFINTRLRKPRKVIVGYWEEKAVKEQLRCFMNVCVAIAESKCLKIARFGDNMRYVAVTEGDKVEAEIKFGWEINGYGIGDLVQYVNAVTDEEVDTLYEDYKKNYNIIDESADNVKSIKYQAKIEIGMERFLVEGGFGAFTTTFEDLHGLDQLPGLAVQRLMEKGYGFAGEGDWKTAAMVRLTKIMASHTGLGTSFMEDYTYHMDSANPMVLGAHMLEICPTIADGVVDIKVNPLSIGGKAAPARMTFECKIGPALNASLIDLGGRMRLIINEVNAVKAPNEMPKLPVAQAMWVPLPSLEEGAKAWILAGGAHHTVYSMDINAEQLIDFAEFMDIETVLINNNTNMNTFKQELKMQDLMWNLKSR